MNELRDIAVGHWLKTASKYNFSHLDSKSLKLDLVEAHKSCLLIKNLPKRPADSEIINYD